MISSIGIEAISYVGTTFLSMILGSHPDCLSVGHFYALFKPYRDSGRHVCEICELLDRECEIVPQKYGKYDKIVIDSSSFTEWFDKSKPDRIIWMFRDPVSLASSYVKSLKGRKKRQESIDYMCTAYIRKYKKAKGLAIDYKYLGDTPELRELFNKLGLEFRPDYLEYWKYDNHMIRGNRGVLIEYAKYHCPEKLNFIIDLVSNGNEQYKKRYQEGFKSVNILTRHEEEYVLDRCGKTYNRLKTI